MKMLLYFLNLLLITMAFSSFADTFESLEAFVSSNKASLPTLQQTNKIDLLKFGINDKNRKDFEKKYELFLTEYDKVFTNYREYDAVKVFTAIKLRDYRELSKSIAADANNPTYMAFALLTGAGIDYEKIGDRGHIHTLALSYGVSDVQIENGIWQTLTKNWDEILDNAVSIISGNLSTLKPNDKSVFMSNVLLPYLTLLSRNRSIPMKLENDIWSSFGLFFPDAVNSSSAFSEYINRFKEYSNGTPLENKYLIKLNGILKKYNFRLSMDINHCAIYSLLPFKIAIDTMGINEILMQKRTGVSLIGFEIGLATYADSDITLTSEYIADEANDIAIILTSDSLPKSFKPAASDLWKNIGLPLTVDSANTIYRALLRKEFDKMDKNLIVNKIIRDVAVHELKHKYDEMLLKDAQRIHFEAEISAHLAEVIYSGIPVYALFSYLNRLQYFYSSVEEVQVQAKLKPLILEAWKLAINVYKGKSTEKEIIAALKLRTMNYLTITGYNFPSLGLFENAIIKKHLKEIPEFNL